MKKVALIIAVLSLQNVFSQVTLMDTTNQYDYVIITVPEFVPACEVFAQHKENVRDMRTLIVDTTMILNEFNSHTMIQDNIRDFISYAGTFWEEPQPKYFLLVGNLNMIPNHEIFEPPVYVAYSDYWYSQSIYDDDSLNVEFYIGRIPASNNVETGNYFNKVIIYESDENLYSWNNNALFLAEYDFTNVFEIHETAIYVADGLPDFINSYFLFEDVSSDPNYLKDSLLFYINSLGMSSFWIFGFSNFSSIGYYNFFTIDDGYLLTNIERPFIVFFWSRQFFTVDSISSFNDKFLLSEGGSIASIASVGLSYFTPNRISLRSSASHLYLQETISLGEVKEMAYMSYPDILRMVTNIWGDPSLKLKYVATTDVEPISSFPTEYSLEQNYPNPFNPKTVINFSIPVSGNVDLKVYNVLGKEVKVLTDRFYNTGRHQVEFDGSELSSGVYLYTISSGDYYKSRKMILIK
jgi:hypothetical protein